MSNNLISPKLVLSTILILFVIFPLTLIFAFPLLLFRHLLEFSFRKIFRRDLSNMLSPTSSVFASDGVYEKPQSVILLKLFVPGIFPVEAFQKSFDSKFKERNFNSSLPSKIDSDSDYIFPELKQYITQWFGYTFWKNEDDFKIEDHIKELKDESLTNQESVLRLVEKLLKKPFEKSKSPWEFLICHDVHKMANSNGTENNTSDVKENAENEYTQYNENNSLIFFLMHHSLGDGVSLNRIFAHIFPPESFHLEEILNKVKGGLPTTSKFYLLIRNPLKLLYFPFKAVYETLESFTSGADQNDWHNYQRKSGNNFKLIQVNPVKLKNLNSIKDKLNTVKIEKGNNNRVSTLSLILSGITIGIRDAMSANACQIPQVIHCACTLPLPGHPEKLSNHMTTCVITLPTGLEDLKSIAEFIQIEISEMKKSSVPWLGALLPNILGICPTSIVKPLSRWNLTTGIVSNFPGPKVQTEIFGHPILDLSAFIALPADISFMAVCFGYNGMLTINIGFNETLFPVKLSQSPKNFIDTAFQQFH